MKPLTPEEKALIYHTLNACLSIADNPFDYLEEVRSRLHPLGLIEAERDIENVIENFHAWKRKGRAFKRSSSRERN